MLVKMELEFTPTAVSVACAVILCCWAWRVLKWVWLKPKKLEKCLRRQGLSGNSYRLLFGDMKDMSRMRNEALSKPLLNFTNDTFPRVSAFLHQTINHYGNNSFVWMGPVPMLNITEPELIREAFSRMHDFQKPKINPLVRTLVCGLASYEGEKWAKHRKLINPAFHMEKLKVMLPAFYTSCSTMVGQWEKMIMDSGSTFQEVDVWPYLVRLSADAISRAAFGSSYEEGRRIFELLKEQTNIVMNIVQSVYIPGWRYLPTKTNKRMKDIDKEIQTLLSGIIHKRKKETKTGMAVDDLLGILMDQSASFKEEGKGSKQSFGMTTKELIDECKLFYFAGQETTSVFLVWTMILLGKHQEWQTRAREEVLKMFGRNKPEFDGLSHLKTVTMIMYEVLRLYPPVISISRRVHNDTKLGNLTLPAGVVVNLQMMLAQHDLKIWGDDAKEFRPERFSEGISKATNGNVSFFPFGWGPRICIGQNFSLTEAKMALVLILQRFSFELSPSYAHAPLSSITLTPQHGAQIVLHRL